MNLDNMFKGPGCQASPATSFSQYTTNFWQASGIYYNVPIRKWSIDTNFKDPTKLPPLTPLIANLVSP
jgi:hypothetical protein